MSLERIWFQYKDSREKVMKPACQIISTVCEWIDELKKPQNNTVYFLKYDSQDMFGVVSSWDLTLSDNQDLHTKLSACNLMEMWFLLLHHGYGCNGWLLAVLQSHHNILRFKASKHHCSQLGNMFKRRMVKDCSDKPCKNLNEDLFPHVLVFYRSKGF